MEQGLPFRFPCSLMTRFIPLLIVLLGSTCGLAADTSTFAHADSDLPVDPAVTFGRLPNGLRYAIMANREPRERAALRLLVDAGSLHETDVQRGLAHFLEHMAFNGSEHYPPGTLIEFFQRMGMNFGGDTNAYTSFDRTVYMIDLPNTEYATLDEGFRVFRDYVGGLLLGQKELDHERGVILSEKRTRDSVEFRSFVAELDFVLGRSRLSKRVPIGLEEVIESAPRSEFVDFYDTWYAPERVTVVAVGDFDPAVAEEKILSAFSDLEARAPARPDPDLGTLLESEGISVLYHAEPESGSTIVGIQSMSPYTFEPDTVENRLKYLPRSLAVSILNRRLTELAKKEGAPFSSGRTNVSEGYDFYRNASIEITCQPEQWEAALAVADHELRRALQYGFQEPELAEVVASFRNGLEQAVKRAPTRRSSALAGQLVGSVADRSVFTTPELGLELFSPALDQVSVDHCLPNRKLRRSTTAPGWSLWSHRSR
jgi:zinc protease